MIESSVPCLPFPPPVPPRINCYSPSAERTLESLIFSIWETPETMPICPCCGQVVGETLNAVNRLDTTSESRNTVQPSQVGRQSIPEGRS